ncbi:MAG: hypothetical protein QOH93_2284 [Chloroflexia bacterium]|jgi:hypothetical protein|nr:hypothetical protein [Chloroflexia bacterium]
MRHKTRAFLIAASLLLLAACNGTGLPVAPTNTPGAGNGSVATPTSESVASLPTSTPRNQARPTRTPRSAQATEAPTKAATAEATEDASPQPTTQADEAKLDKEVKQVEKDAATVRGLQPQADVPETFLTQPQMKNNLLQDITRDYPRAEADDDAMQLWLLRLVDDPKMDLLQLQIDLLGEQVLGYYDPKKDELFVLRNQADLSPGSKQTLAHEFVHALQDQHFDLEKLLPDESHDDDGSLAIRSLVEGDATLAGLSYARDYFSQSDIQKFLDESSSADSSVLNSSPPYLRESLYFPYDQGADFVNELLMRNGFQAVDSALADPPSSTEQIMHPDKYFDSPRDEPIQVPLKELTGTLGTGWTMNDWGTLGEFDFKVILEENGAADPDEGAAGWGGASYAYYRNAASDLGLLYMATEWDNRREADQFLKALQETFDNANKTGDLYDQDGRFYSLKQDGSAVMLISSNDRAAVESAGK